MGIWHNKQSEKARTAEGHKTLRIPNLTLVNLTNMLEPGKQTLGGLRARAHLSHRRIRIFVPRPANDVSSFVRKEERLQNEIIGATKSGDSRRIQSPRVSIDISGDRSLQQRDNQDTSTHEGHVQLRAITNTVKPGTFEPRHRHDRDKRARV